MDSFQQIYAARAAEYHRMITREDVERHLIAALQAVCPVGPLASRRVVDIGSGAGRLPILLNGIAGQVLTTEFFFGPELAAQICARGWARLPEWTGIWGKQLES